MKKTRNYFYFALAAVALLGAFIYFDIDFVPLEGSDHPSAEASHDHYLAAGRLLEHRGHPVTYLPNYQAAPPGRGALLLIQPGNSLAPKQADKLLAWVRQGNLLLMTASGEPGSEHVGDPLLDPLGARAVVDTKKRAAASPLIRRLTDALGAKEKPQEFPWLHVGTQEGDLQTSFLSHNTLDDSKDKAEWGMGDKNGVHVLSYAVGDGHILVLSDSQLFRNDEIGKADNAALLLNLVEIPEHQRVWLVFNGHYPTLSHLIWQYGKPLVLSALLLLVVWLWWSARRFGPLLAPVASPRRQLSEHLRACGRYLWYAGQQPRLYKAMRSSLRRRLIRRHPHWRQLGSPELVSALAEFSGMESATLQRALVDPPTSDLPRFLHDVRVMNHLRKML